MSEHDDVTGAPAAIGVGELLEKLNRGEDLFLLDVRNRDEFESWRLEGRHPLPTVHVPYFDFLEAPEASIAKVPRDRQLVVLCAMGGSSQMVVDQLREAGIASRNVAGGMVAYGDHLEPVRVPLTAAEACRFELWQVNRRGKGCLSYVVRAGREAVVVDPSRRTDWYEAFVAGLGARIVRVLDTHVHADHVSGGPALAERLGVPYSVAAGPEFELRRRTAPLADGEELQLGGPSGVSIRVRVLRTPGHTPGSTSYLAGGRFLLTGDTLFVASVGRPDLGGHVEAWGRELFETLHRRLEALGDDTVILPAHYGGPSELGPDGVVAGRLGDLRRRVPEMLAPSPEAFVEMVGQAVRPPPEAYGHLVAVNLGTEEASPEKVAEWELGKNQCAVAAAKHAA